MSQIWQVSEGILRDGDVLLEVDGYPIAPDGTVMFPRPPPCVSGCDIACNGSRAVSNWVTRIVTLTRPSTTLLLRLDLPHGKGGGWPLLSRSPSECRMVSLDAQKDAPAPRTK